MSLVPSEKVLVLTHLQILQLMPGLCLALAFIFAIASFAGPYIALDGDMLSQFLYLPSKKQKDLLTAMDSYEGLRRAIYQARPCPSVSLPNIIQVLENALPVC